MRRSPVQRLRAALPWIAAGVFLLAAYFVGRTLREFGGEAIADAVASIGPRPLTLAAACTAGSYLTLTAFDSLAVRYATDVPVRYRRIALASFTALSVGHVVGLAGLSSGALRYRIYSERGMREGDVARVVLFSGATVGLGLAAVAGVGCLLEPSGVARFARLPPPAVVGIGLACALAVAGYVAWTGGGASGSPRSGPPGRPADLGARRGREVLLRGFRLPLPPPRGALLQIAAGALNYLLVAGALRALLGGAVEVSFPTFAAYYAAAHALGILSHVPGGLGVLESIVLAAAPSAATAGALIAFRIVYSLVPFALGALVYAAFELRRRRTGRRLAPRDPAE